MLLTHDCGQKLQIKEELAGKRIQCPKCAATFMVPLPAVTETASRVSASEDAGWEDDEWDYRGLLCRVLNFAAGAVVCPEVAVPRAVVAATPTLFQTAWSLVREAFELDEDDGVEDDTSGRDLSENIGQAVAWGTKVVAANPDTGLSGLLCAGTAQAFERLRETVGTTIGSVVNQVTAQPVHSLLRATGVVEPAHTSGHALDPVVVATAFRLGRLCAYAPDPHLQERLDPWTLEPLTDDPLPRCYLAQYGEESAVVFRGSVHPRSMGRNQVHLEGCIRDWGANFSWELVTEADSPGHVCQGFQSLLDEVWPALESRLSGLGPVYKLNRCTL